MEDSHLLTLAPRILGLSVLLLFLGGQEGMAQGADPAQPGVAVMDFTGLMIGQGGNSAPLGKAVSAMLTTELSGRDGMRVVDRTLLQDLLTEQRLALSGRVDESTAIEVGRMVGANYVIHGSVTSIGDQTRMDMRAVDVETGEVLEVQKLTGATTELLFLVVRMADIFSQQLELAPPSERPGAENIPVMATIAFSRGVDFEDKKEMEKAIEQYERALELYPDHRDAQKALARLQGGGEDR
jgi:TolB-like protein